MGGQELDRGDVLRVVDGMLADTGTCCSTKTEAESQSGLPMWDQVSFMSVLRPRTVAAAPRQHGPRGAHLNRVPD